MEYLLGIDIGTYSSKGVLVDRDGTVYASHQENHELSMPQAGWAEHDPENVWWKDVLSITMSLMSQSGLNAGGIAGIGISTIAPCVVPVDKFGNALRPAILYGIDTRASREIEYLESSVGAEEIFKRSGVMLSAQSCTPKIL